jgi:thiamine-phosphate diphosphorylase
MRRHLQPPIVALVTHGERLAARREARPEDVENRLVAQVREASLAGVDLVQVRELELETDAVVRLVERAVAAARGTAARIIVNDRYDVARAAGAHGIHLRGDSYPAARVRSMAPPGFLIGRSVHDPDEAAAVVQAGGIDYLVFGTVFQTASKPAGHVPAGLEGLAAVVRAADGVPVLAIGGVSVESAPRLAQAGAAGLAAIGLFLPGEVGAGPTIAATVAALHVAFDSATERH